MSCEHAETNTLLWLYGEGDDAHAQHVAACEECTEVASLHADTGAMVAPVLPVLRRPHTEGGPVVAAAPAPQPANNRSWLVPFAAGVAASAVVFLGLGGLPGEFADPVGDTVALVEAVVETTEPVSTASLEAELFDEFDLVFDDLDAQLDALAADMNSL